MIFPKFNWPRKLRTNSLIRDGAQQGSGTGFTVNPGGGKRPFLFSPASHYISVIITLLRGSTSHRPAISHRTPPPVRVSTAHLARLSYLTRDPSRRFGLHVPKGNLERIIVLCSCKYGEEDASNIIAKLYPAYS